MQFVTHPIELSDELVESQVMFILTANHIDSMLIASKRQYKINA